MKRVSFRSAVLLAVVAAAVVLIAKTKTANHPADEHQRVLQALDRLTFGPRPGDVEAVTAMGVDKWIDLQLHPEGIDNSSLQPRLAQYRTLTMTSREIALNFPPEPLLKAAKEGKFAIPNDDYRHAIYMAGIARLDNKQAEKQAAAAAPSDNPMLQPVSQSAKGSPERRQEKRETRDAAELLIPLPPDVRMQRILALPALEQSELFKSLPAERKQQLLAGLTPVQRETVIALSNPQGLVNYEAQSGKLLRAVYSDRQLEEVLADFWFNHFNVYINKGADRYLVTAYERDVIRPHVFGKFKDLLIATAQSPAMLFYLDNWQSEGPNSPAALGQPKQSSKVRRVRGPFGTYPVVVATRTQPNLQPNAKQKKARSGLNENYARELMELHTLGVNGGYTQQDVTEVAKVFTGWTLKDPREGGGFEYKERLHEPGPKTVLGHKIKPNGEKEGMQVLDLLAHQPATAHFISLKLAERFVSDNPPPALVDQMAATFRKTDGDLREVMRTMLQSPQFWAPETYRAKVKTPFEFVVSSLRATGSNVTETQPLLNQLDKMGMQIYGMQPPTGYSTNAEKWVNSAALLDRMNFALALVNNRIPGTRFDAAKLVPRSDANPLAVQVQLEQSLLLGVVSAQTHQTIEQQLGNPAAATASHAPSAAASNPNTTVALLLGSPEFQRR